MRQGTEQRAGNEAPLSRAFQRRSNFVRLSHAAKRTNVKNIAMWVGIVLGVLILVGLAIATGLEQAKR